MTVNRVEYLTFLDHRGLAVHGNVSVFLEDVHVHHQLGTVRHSGVELDLLGAQRRVRIVDVCDGTEGGNEHIMALILPKCSKQTVCDLTM